MEYGAQTTLSSRRPRSREFRVATPRARATPSADRVAPLVRSDRGSDA